VSRKSWLALGAAFGLSWAGGAALAAASGGVAPSSSSPSLAAAVASAPSGAPDEQLCAGGVAAPVDIRIAPARSVVRGGSESLELDVSLVNKLGGAAAARYGVEIVDDRGRPVAAATRSPRIDLATPGAAHSASIEAPSGLADGYYVVRVTAAAAPTDRTAGAAGSQIAESYLRADGGSVYEVDSDEYFARSRASKGVRL
jgi:hypothetical protein